MISNIIETVKNNDLLLNRLRVFLDNTEVANKNKDWTNEVLNMINTEDSNIVLDNIRNITEQYLGDTGVFSKDRWDIRSEQRVKLIVQSLPVTFKPQSILDIGCSEGTITSRLGSYYGVSSNQIYGVDTRCDRQLNDIDFQFTKISQDEPLPYKDNSIDLITASMVLHHVTNIDTMINEINRVLKPGGYIVIAEHDTGTFEGNSEDLVAFLNLVHAFYDVVLSNPQSTTIDEFNNNYSATYMDKDELIEILEDKELLKYYVSNTVGNMNKYTLVMHKIIPYDSNYNELELANIWQSNNLFNDIKNTINRHPYFKLNKIRSRDFINYIDEIGPNYDSDIEVFDVLKEFLDINTKEYPNEPRSKDSHVIVVYEYLVSPDIINSIYNEEKPGNILLVMKARNNVESIINQLLYGKYSGYDGSYTIDYKNIGYEFINNGRDYVTYKKPSRATYTANASVKSHYDNKTLVPLNESPIRFVRSYNNWIKSTLIDEYVNKGDVVVDFAAGKGADILKYIHAGVSELLLVDISPESLKEAQNRISKLNLKDNNITIKTMEANIGTNIQNELQSNLTRKANVISCQFALHYLVNTWDTLYETIDNMDSVIDSGYIIFTIPDSQYILNQLGNKQEFGNELFNIKIVEPEVDDEHPMKYHFYLKDSIDLPEYILETKELVDASMELRWKLILDQNFADYYKSSNRTVPELKLLKQLVFKDNITRIPEDNWDIIKLYKIVIFEK